VFSETAMWLRRNSTRALLGVDPAAPEFATINNEVTTAFRSVLDGWRPTTPYVAALLERGVRVLVYVGENDWACNWVGNAAWTEQLEWSGGDGYRATPEGVWQMDGEVKGRHRVSGGLSFVTIRGAGHMVSPEYLRWYTHLTVH
jgi:carboxypeptidase C (cathepsin A)